MKVYLVTLTIDNGATYEEWKVLVREKNKAAALQKGMEIYMRRYCGYDDSIEEARAVEFREDLDYLVAYGHKK